MHDIIEISGSTAQEKLSRQSTSIIASSVLILLTLLVIFGSMFIILYATSVRPTELNIQATAIVNTLLTQQAQATATNSPQFVYNRLTSKFPSINAPLDVPGAGWVIGKQGNSSCTFAHGSYHVLVGNTHQVFLCQEEGNIVNNFVFQVQMAIIHGSTGGILFRGTSRQGSGYLFTITSNRFYAVSTIIDNMTNGHILAFGHSTALFAGLNQSNTLTIIARGKYLSFYINQKFVNSSIDSTFSAGVIGMIAARVQYHTATDVAFNNAQLWIL